MSQPKQQQQVPLNGAYYGPPIPPQPVYAPRRSPCRRLISVLLTTIVTVVILLGITTLVLWIVYRPTRMKVYVEEASITQFNLTNQNILHYNLYLDVSLRNPNKRIGIYYDKLEARAYYDSERFGSIFLPAFYQGHKNTTVVRAVFEGQNFVQLSTSDMQRFNSEKGAGSFYVDVNIYARVRFKVGSVKTKRYRPDFECELRVPVVANGASNASFVRTKCDVDF